MGIRRDRSVNARCALRWRCRQRVAGIGTTLAILAFLSHAAASGGERWRTYVNDRYGFTVSYPASALRPQPPPVNGDGRTFAAADGRTILRVWATLSGGSRPGAAYRQARRELAAEGGLVYARRGGDWFVVSGYSSTGDIIYRRVRLACGGRVRLVAEFVYPASQRRLWDPLVGRTTRSLRMPAGRCRAYR